jgi:hypothetical protein
MRRCLFVLISTAAVAGHSAHGSLIILGNLPAVNDASGATIDAGVGPGTGGSQVRQAVSFTMPPRSYPVVQVNLHLGQYNTAAGDVAAVGFYLDNGNDLPGTLVGHLLNPSSNSDDIQPFIFAPAMPVTLAASTKYWLVVDATAGTFAWRSSAPSITPTSPVGATYGKQIGFVNDVPRDITILISSFEINTQVPEPGSLPLVMPSALLALSGKHRVRGPIALKK